MGWFTVAAYAIGAVLAILAARAKGGSSTSFQERGPWLVAAFVMAGLCVNKQLDLQSLLTDLGRVVARHRGWYDQRREVQKWFVIAALGGAGSLGCWSFWRFRTFWIRHKLLALGSLFLLTFIVVRAISFHHVDVFLGTRWFGFKMNWAFELTGIGLVSVAAFREACGRRMDSAC